MGRPFKGVIGCDPNDGMNYFRGTISPDWQKSTAAILLEFGDGPVTQPQYVPPSWTGEGYYALRDNNDGKLKSFHAYGNIMATIRSDIPEFRDTALQEATKSDLAKYLLDMPDYDLMTFVKDG